MPARRSSSLTWAGSWRWRPRHSRDWLGVRPRRARLTRRLIPRLEARPYRLCDGGKPVLRAHLTLDLAPLIPDAQALEGRTNVLRRELVVDLFDMPQRAAYRERVIALRPGRTEREVAAELGLTVAAAQKAASLDRLMGGWGSPTLISL